MVNSPVYPPFLRLRAHTSAAASSRRRCRRTGGSTSQTLDRGLRGGARAAAAARHTCSATRTTRPGAVHTADELTTAARAGRGPSVCGWWPTRSTRPLVYAPTRFTPYLSLPAGARAFSLMSASKGFNLAGPEGRPGPGRSGGSRRPGPDAGGGSLTGRATSASSPTARRCRDGEAWLDALLGGLDRNRRLLAELLAEHLPEVGYRVPAGDATSPGSTAAPWAWARTRPPSSGSAAVWRSARGPASAPAARDMPASTSPRRRRFSPRRWSGWRPRSADVTAGSRGHRGHVGPRRCHAAGLVSLRCLRPSIIFRSMTKCSGSPTR